MQSGIGVRVLIASVALSLAGAAFAGQGADPRGAAAHPARPAQRPVLIDINSASVAQLKTLPGIGSTEAARIVAGRPYLSKASLVTNHVIPAGVYQAIRHRILAIQHEMPKRPATTGAPPTGTS